MLDNRGSADSHVTGYRPDIDGLRAVAVLSVVVYHLSERWVQGGFLGVDIFFVLSGYLITGIVWREAQEGRFSIRRFYERRVRRILPALLAMLAVVSALSARLLLSVDLIGYAKSVFATLGFVANVYFWRDTNYFSRLAAEKPLLHVWSLGVEEQFYILFPLLLMACYKWRRRWVFPLVTLLVAASLAGDVLAIRAGASSPAFFLLPTRAWEMGLGAMLAVAPWKMKLGRVGRELLASVAAWLMFEGLAYGVTLYYGWAPGGLLVTAGAVLVILVGSCGGSWLNRALSVRPVVGVGLISYSLYLWHWPLLVLWRYYLVRELRPGEMAALVVVMFLLAYLSWRFIERPFRRREMPVSRVLAWTGAGCALVAMFAAAAWTDAGWPERYSPEVARVNAAVGTNYRCAVSDYIAFGASRGCLMNLSGRSVNEATVVLLGNSHAQMYAPLVTEILKEHGQGGVLVPANGCLPMTAVNVTQDCFGIARTNLNAVEKLPNVKVVVLAMTWPAAYFDGNRVVQVDEQRRALTAGLDRLIDRLQRDGKRVVLVGPILTPDWDMASIIGREMAFGHPVTQALSAPESQFNAAFAGVVAHFAARKDITFIRPDTVQCGNGRCDFFRDGAPLFADSNHIADGELPLFRSVFEAGLGNALARQ